MTGKVLPKIDSRGREALFEEMRLALMKKGISAQADDGELVSTLVTLYSHMLYGTIARLNRAPEKHRAEFLNLAHTPPRPAWAATTVVAFEVASGYDSPVEIDKGACVTAQGKDAPISFRLTQDLTAVPASITDIVWCDKSLGRYGTASVPTELSPWENTNTREIAYKADFIFENLFYNTNEVHFLFSAVSGETPVPAESLNWSVSAWPRDEDDGGAQPVFLPVQITDNAGGVRLKIENPPRSEKICLHMELSDPRLADIRVERIRLRPISGEAAPDAVLAGGRLLSPESFYPFGSPFGAFEECGIFCGAALSQNGAEISVSFDLSLEVTEEWPYVPPEAVDYKWVMRKPRPKPGPMVFEAFAGNVRLEYWNGSAYREINDIFEEVLDFKKEKNNITLRFLCPDDLKPGGYGGLEGYFLRLSCGECGELYQTPRRVFTPRIDNLSLSFSHTGSFEPVAVYSESFGRCVPVEGGALFSSPEEDRLLMLGFDRLDFECGLHLYISVNDQDADAATSMKAWLLKDGGKDELQMYDATKALSQSGKVRVELTGGAEPCRMFGKERYWITFSPGSQVSPYITGIFLNAAIAQNLTKCEDYFSYSHLSGHKLSLSHAGLVSAKISVRSLISGEMEPWKEYEAANGHFRMGFYKIDFESGLVTFPPEIIGHEIAGDTRDVISAVYYISDGAAANLPAGAINRMEDEIPFIQSVQNPIDVVNGADCETAEELARRKEHMLFCGGAVVSKRDYELLAADLCPLVHSAKCVFDKDKRRLELAVLLEKDEQSKAFTAIKTYLNMHLKKLGAPGSLNIVPAEKIKLVLKIKIREKSEWAAFLPQLQKALSDFLDPVSGGRDGNGWPIGELPDSAQIKAFLRSVKPRLNVVTVEIISASNVKYPVLGEVRVKWEDADD